jgi:hypothetical protein
VINGSFSFHHESNIFVLFLFACNPIIVYIEACIYIYIYIYRLDYSSEN